MSLPSYILPLAKSLFTLGDGLLLLGILMVTLSLLMRLRKRQKGAGQRLTAREELERARQSRGLRGDMEELMVEVEQLAKRLGAQLDAKSIQIERLVREADEKIAHLQRLQDETTVSKAAVRVSPQMNSRPPHPESTPTTAPTTSSVEDLLTKSIYELADAGTDPVEIAKNLDEHVGKVELILALRNA